MNDKQPTSKPKALADFTPFENLLESSGRGDGVSTSPDQGASQVLPNGSAPRGDPQAALAILDRAPEREPLPGDELPVRR